MSNQLPGRAQDIISSATQCTVPVDGYNQTDTDHVYARGNHRLPDAAISVKGDNSGLWVAEDAYAQINLEIKGNNSGIIIGPNCRLRKLTARVTGDNTWIIFGTKTTSEGVTILASPSEQHIIFGDDCMISSGVVVRANDGHSVFDRNTRERLNYPASVNIGAHVWLGNGSRINKGVTIGEGTIVGQQSIVSGTLEPHSTYAGVPARHLRKDVVWSRTLDYDDIPEFGR